MGGDDLLSDISATSDGKIIAVGQSTNRLGLVRLTASGAIDRSFGTNGRVFETHFDSSGTEMLMQPDGSFIVAGVDTSVGNAPARGIRDFNADGKPTGFTMAKFTVAEFDRLVGSAQDSDGNIVLLGRTNGPGGSTAFVLRATKSGKLDTTFGTGGIVTIDSNNGDFPESIATTVNDAILASTSNATVIVFKLLGTNASGSGSGVTLGTDGTLTVTGTDSNDTITIARSSTNVVVTRNGVETSFASASVKQLYVDGLGGNDKIIDSLSIRSTLAGGEGNDSIKGGTAMTSLAAVMAMTPFTAARATTRSTAGSALMISSVTAALTRPTTAAAQKISRSRWTISPMTVLRAKGTTSTPMLRTSSAAAGTI